MLFKNQHMKAKHPVGIVAVLVGATLSASGQQMVVVDKTKQELRGYDGGLLVFQTKISTGRAGRETPAGRYRVRWKTLMHYSTLYENAPMPYSVQISGNYFIHGFSVVPDFPASHGCIRVPLTGDNPARNFYNWVDHGTPVVVVGHWPGPPKRVPFFSRLLSGR